MFGYLIFIAIYLMIGLGVAVLIQCEVKDTSAEFRAKFPLLLTNYAFGVMLFMWPSAVTVVLLRLAIE